MSDGWLTHDFRTMKPTFWRLHTFILNFWRPNADNLFQNIKYSTSGLNEANFLQLAVDSPNVSWIALNKLDDMLIANGHEKTVNIGSCAQHKVHGGFQTRT